jgi:hypothetical protein
MSKAWYRRPEICLLIRIRTDFISLLAMKTISSRDPIMALVAGAVLITGISTIYSTGLGGPSSSAAYAAAETVVRLQEKIPVDGTVFDQCAAGLAGEDIHLTGEAHVAGQATFDSAGGFHAVDHFNFQGISGTGLTTGDKYQATDADNIEFNGKVGTELIQGLNINFIGQGNVNNLLIHVTLHTTINADGTMTAFVDNLRVECQLSGGTAV